MIRHSIVTRISAVFLAGLSPFIGNPLAAQESDNAILSPQESDITSPTIFIPTPVTVPPSRIEADPYYKFLPAPMGSAEEMQEQNLLMATMSAFSTEADEQDASEMLSKLDALLPKLNKPTKARGHLQLMRAQLLYSENKFAETKLALDESIRLLPNYTGPLLFGAEFFAPSNNAALAMEYLVRAAAIHPRSIDLVDSYTVSTIMQRLTFANDNDRVHKLSSTLLKNNWTRGTPSLRSTMASTVIRHLLKIGDVEAAKAYIPNIINPIESYRLLTNKNYEAIWPALEEWSGPKMERQWSLYLTDLRAQWKASNSAEDIRAYTNALRAANASDLIIRDILPVFDNQINNIEDSELLLFVVAPVATALAQKGRWDEAFSLFDKAEKIFAKYDTANILNIRLNHSRLMYFHGDHINTINAIDKQIVELDSFGDEVNADARSQLLSIKICALAELGKKKDALKILATSGASTPFVFTDMHLCVGQFDQAKSIILRQLQFPDKRGDVIAWLQPDTSILMDSEVSRARRIRWNRLKSDPAILAAIKKYGRLMPYSSIEGAQSAVAALQSTK